MAEVRLDIANVDPGLDQMCPAGVPQGVREHPTTLIEQPRTSPNRRDDPPDILAGQAPPADGHEHRVGVARPRPTPMSDQLGPTDSAVIPARSKSCSTAGFSLS